MSITAQALREYAAALRGYWGGIDGRSEMIALNGLADQIETPTTTDIVSLRRVLDVCETGYGHWHDYCDEDCGCPCTKED